MKLIDIMKRYNRCILKENAKLRSIYNTLIRECDANECDANECDTEGDTNECDTEGDTEGDNTNECDANECDA